MTNGTISYRDAQPDDLPAVREFLQPFIQARLVLPRNDEDLLVLLRHGFMAEHENQLVGFASVEIYSKKLAEVQALAVASTHRRQGIGKRLVDRCVERAEQQGVLELMAITTSDALFQSAGFHYSLPNKKRALFLQTGEHHE